MTFPSLGIAWSFIWEYANSSVIIPNVTKLLLPNSQELRCSAIAGVLADVRLPLPDTES